MTTVEKLLVQMFERKNSIIDQVKQQTELYSQHLASKLLIDGITPPSWLWNPNTSSDSKELNKEELISKLLRPYPQPSARCSVAHYPLYDNLVRRGDNEEFSDGVFMENLAFNEGFNRQDHPTVPPLSSEDRTDYALNYIPELDFSVTSPEDQTNERIENIYNAPDHSLAGIHRSKSRQKALQLRSSAKSLAKSGVSNEKIRDSFPSQIRFSLEATNQAGQNDEHPKLPEPCVTGSQSCANWGLGKADSRRKENEKNANSGRLTRSRSYAKVPDFVRGSLRLGCSSENCKGNASSHISEVRRTQSMHIPDTDNYCNDWPKSARLSPVYCQSCADTKMDGADCLSNDKGTDVFADRMTRSSISSKSQSYGRDSSKADISSDDYQRIDTVMVDSGDDLSSEPVYGSPPNPSNVPNEDPGTRKSISGDCQSHRARGSVPSCSSNQQNGCAGEVSDLETHSHSAKTDGVILASRLTRSRSYAKIPDCVRGSLALGCSSENCKGNESSHISEVRRTQSVHVPDSDYYGNKWPKSARPSTVNCQSCADKKVDGADCLSNDKGTDVFAGRMTTSNISSKSQSYGRDSSKADISFNDYQRVDTVMVDSRDDLPSESVYGSPPNPSNVLNEDSGTRESISGDCQSHRARGSVPSCSSSQQNGCAGEVSDLETRSHSAKADGVILASRLTRSRSYAKVPDFVRGSLTLGCSSENCKGDASSHISEVRRTQSMHIPDSDNYGNKWPKSARPSTYCQSCADTKTNGADCLSNDKSTGDFAGRMTRSNISSKSQSYGRDSSNIDISSDDYQRIDTVMVDRRDDLPSESVYGSPPNPSNVLNEDSGTRKSISGDCQSHRARGSIPSCISNQQNGCAGEVSDLETCSHSAKADGVILASRCTRSRSYAKVADFVGGSLTLDWSSENCKGNAPSHISKVRRTQSMHIPDSDNYGNKWPKSARPSTVYCQSCADTKMDGADSLSNDKGTDVFVGRMTRSNISSKSQSYGRDSSKADISSDDYQIIDTVMVDSRDDLPPELVYGSPPNPSNVLNEDSGTRKSISEDCQSHRARGSVPSCSSNQQNGCAGEVSDIETRSHSAKGDGVIRAPLSGKSAQEVHGFVKPSVGLFGRVTRSQTPTNEKQQCQPVAYNENSGFESIQTLKWGSGLQAQHSVLSPRTDDLELTDVDQSVPVLEGFIVDAQEDSGLLGFAADGIDFDKLKLPSNTIERASILAEICRSASLDKPSSHFSSAFEFEGNQNLYQSVPNGHLEHLDLSSSLPSNSDVGEELLSVSSQDDCKESLDGIQYSDCLAYSGIRFGWNLRSQSPVGKLWERLSSHNGSSEKRFSSNPELTCFPIEEDDSISEEHKTGDENAGDVQEIDSSLAKHCDKRQPFKDFSNLGLYPPMSVSAHKKALSVDSVDFVRPKLNVTEMQDKVQSVPKNKYRNKSETSEKHTSSICATDGRINQTSLQGTNGIKKAKESINDSISKSSLSIKTGLGKQDQKLSLKEAKRNNIISNVNSFIPLVQQKQAATVYAGKRDVKVKALEAAEASKRLEEKKENERKMRKEALKLERAKLEEKNLKQLELEKKKKEEERKKKDADIIARKRQREEEEKKEKVKKRMRLEARYQQREQGEKMRAGKTEKENRWFKDDQLNNKKELLNESKKEQNREIARGDDLASKKEDTKLTTTEVAMNYEECGTSGHSREVGKAMHAVEKSPKNEDLIVRNSQGRSYEISPYQCSDDEDEEDDELPTKKYIPSWSSKSSVALLLHLQQEIDPDTIFPGESFCTMEEVLLPRKLQQKLVAA